MDVFSWCPCLGIEYPARTLWCVATASLRIANCRFLLTAYHALSLVLRTRRDKTTEITHDMKISLPRNPVRASNHRRRSARRHSSSPSHLHIAPDCETTDYNA